MTNPEIVWPRSTLGLRHVFLPVERVILAATYAALPAPAARLLRVQIEQMRCGQRHLSWTEVLFYPQRPPTLTDPQWADSDLFPNRHQDLKISKVSIKVGAQRHTTFVHVVVGHFFAITSRPGLKAIRRATPETVSVVLLADPMDPAAAPPRTLPRSYKSFDYIRRDHLFTGLPMSVGDRFVDDFYVVGADHVHYPEQMAVTVTRDGKTRTDVVTELLKFLRYRYELSERALYHHGKVAADAMIGKLLEMWSDAEWAELAEEQAASAYQRVGAGDITVLQDAVRADDPALAKRIDGQVRDLLEAEFVRWSDDGLLEFVAMVAAERAAEGDSRYGAISDLVTAVLNRQLYKPLGHARGGDAVALAENVYAQFGSPERRRTLEREAAEYAELKQGWHVVLWVPNPKMKLKVADVLVDHDGEIMPLSRFTENGDDIVVAHRQLWGVEVYGHQDVRDDPERSDAILSFVGSRLGVTIKRRDGSEVPKPRELAIDCVAEKLRLNSEERSHLLDLVPAAKNDAGTFRSQVRLTERLARRNNLGSP